MTSIALNARFYAHRPTGMQRYALELSRRFPDYLDPVRPTKSLGGTAGHLWEQLYLPSAVHGRLLWSPNNTGPLAVERQVCTVHDLIPIDHPEWFNIRFARWYEWLLPRLAKRVRHIIAISEFTKQRVVDLLRVKEDKVTVIPNGVDNRFCPQSSEAIESMRRALQITNKSYLLCVGSLEPRKNLLRLLEAWKIAMPRIPDKLELVVAGAPGNSRVFGTVAIASVPARVHFTGYVPEEYLPGLYAGAVAMVYPSLYEGFGLPPLEAMACGTPVVTSNGTSLPEVVGGSAVLVDPYDAASIADGIVKIASSQSLRDSLAEQSRTRAARFTWEHAAHQTLRVLLEQTLA
jgi:glycosyltransferase involved in cell wall biosynthesis